METPPSKPGTLRGYTHEVLRGLRSGVFYSCNISACLIPASHDAYEKVLALLAIHPIKTWACAKAGISRASFYAKLDRDPEYAKLLAAWDGLSCETQILALSKLDGPTDDGHSGSWVMAIWAKAQWRHTHTPLSSRQQIVRLSVSCWRPLWPRGRPDR